jgi:diguanylate cyclase (GGDEF)-like protein/PAS domain S-box-containing protein
MLQWLVLSNIAAIVFWKTPLQLKRYINNFQVPKKGKTGKMNAKTEKILKCGKTLRSILLMLLTILISPFSVTVSRAAETSYNGGAYAGQRLKTIIVNNYYPYTFLNDRGEPDGFSVDIAKAAATAMDLELEIRVEKWDQAMKELEAGSIDLLPMMAYSPERDKIFDFSVPYTIAYDAIFIKKGNTSLRTLKDLSGKTVIVTNNDAAHSYLLSSGLSKKMNLNLVDSLPEALKQLDAGKGDAAIMPKLVGMITAKDLKLSDIEPSPLLINEYNRPFSFAAKQGNQALMERLNQGLNIIKSTGQYDKIYKKWFGALEDSHLHWKTALKFGSAAVLILLVFIAWNMVLKRQVKSKTAHLEAEIAQRKKNEQALRESEEKHKNLANEQRIILNTSSVGIGLIKDRKIIWANHTYDKIFGYETGTTQNMDTSEFYSDEESRGVFGNKVYSTLESGGTHSQDLMMKKKDGSQVWCNLVGQAINPVNMDDGSIWVIMDISDRKKAEVDLRDSEKRFRTILENAPIGMAVLTLAGRFLLVNRSLCEIVGYEKKELEKLTYQEITHPDDLEANLANVQRVQDGSINSYFMEKRYIRKDQQIVWTQLTSSVVRNAAGAPRFLIAQIEDITDRKRNREQIHHLAYYDALTTLPNRRLLLDRLNQAIAQAKRYQRSLALMFLDLDNFKLVNDTLGHDVGDELLKVVASRLHACVRGMDTVCRQGGDEFIIVLSEITQPEDAAVVANKIIKAINEPVSLQGNELHITTSIGIAVYPVDGIDDVKELMKKADKAMYETKNNGRNGFTFYQSS